MEKIVESQPSIGTEAEGEDGYDENLRQFSAFYILIVEKTMQENGKNDATFEIFQHASKIMVKGQRYRTGKQVETLPEWFNQITRTIREDNPSISLLAIEAMIEILISEKVDAVYSNLR